MSKKAKFCILIFALVIVIASYYAISYSNTIAKGKIANAKIEMHTTLEQSKVVRHEAKQNAEAKYESIIASANNESIKILCNAKGFSPDYLQLAKELQKELK
ncbi:MAG: hypothetical protein RSE41_07940 [Clostridia bacterium]